MPPLGDTEPAAVQDPAQGTFAVGLPERLSNVGSVIVTALLAVQPITSVMVTIYEPAGKPEQLTAAQPVDQLYWYGPKPPEGKAETLPSLPPKQLTGFDCAETVG